MENKLSVTKNNSHNSNSTSSDSPSVLEAAEVMDRLCVNITESTFQNTGAVNNSGSDMVIQMGHLYFWMTGCMSVASMFGSVIIIVTYVAFPDLQTSGRRLLVYLSIADFFTALGNLFGILWYILKDEMPVTVGHNFCQFHAVLTICSSISSFLWTVVIAVHLYLCIVKGSKQTALCLFPYFHLICRLLPGKV